MKIAAIVIGSILIVALTGWVVYNVVQIVKTLKERKRNKATTEKAVNVDDISK